TVVRLTAQSVVLGDDLEMATLGFGEGSDDGPVGKERRRPLGFPGWALVNDPKNARYALDVVKEFKKHARKAKSKPGHARDGIEALAARLGKTVPHFLPSFYEEAGRAFIEHGAPSFAAAVFGKARAGEGGGGVLACVRGADRGAWAEVGCRARGAAQSVPDRLVVQRGARRGVARSDRCERRDRRAGRRRGRGRAPGRRPGGVVQQADAAPVAEL